MTGARISWSRLWWSSALLFTASLCFFLAAGLGGDPTALLLVAGGVNWLAGFCALVRLRGGRAEAVRS